MDILTKAKAKAKADQEFGSAFRAEMHTFKALDIDMFWPVVDLLKAKIVSRVRYGTGVKDGCHNLFCALVYNSSSDTGIKGWPEDMLGAWQNLARFITRYEEVKAVLSKKCWDMRGLERGDDGYGDLMDSLVLAGREVFDGIMGDDIATFKQLETALADHPLKDFILQGENYICMTFEKTLMKAFLSVARDLEPESEDDRPRENPHVVLNVTPNESKERWSRDTVALNITVSGPFRDEHEAGKFAGEHGKDSYPVRIYPGIVKK